MKINLERMMQTCHRWRRRTFPPSTDVVKQLFADLQADLYREIVLKQSELEKKIVISTAPIILKNYLSSVHSLQNNDDVPIFNPSVLEIEIGYMFCARKSNLLNKNDGYYYYKNGEVHDTLNILYYFDKSLKFLSQRILDDSFLRNNCKFATNGIENIRIFLWRGETFGIGSGISLFEERLIVTQILIKIENDRIIEYYVLGSPVGSEIEKNWIPLVVKDQLFFIYSISPLVIFRFDGGSISLFKGDAPKNNQFIIRGGTPMIGIKNKFLSIAHIQPIRFEKKIYYHHVFVVLDSNLDVDEISEPFFIQRKGIEFACGLHLLGEDLLISYGVSDRSANFCILPGAELSGLLAI